ncbi:unnamed protein product [Candida verbasci]|uniref:N-(5'-phosphoribosyl)anthranilate isomerase n=1 Tax=Candida verbasci TaxID=1227364 RepID=A0A9W4TW94_9ASCO|nr:unnamed protein product [Candida verbasci]
MLVKICGISDIESAKCAIDNGANLIGCILVPNRSRTINHEIAKEISKLVKSKRTKQLKIPNTTNVNEYFEELAAEISRTGPYLVGVFRNQPRDDVIRIATELELDFIQLHGNEDKLEYLGYGFGVIPRYIIPKEHELLKEHADILVGQLSLPLLDSDLGGEGKTIDWDYINEKLDVGSILAGGLTSENLPKLNNIIGFDVSGGVETNGKKDLNKIEKFIKKGRSIQ